MTPHIGTEWLDRNKRLCRVFDIYVTTNSAGVEMRREYASYHTFLGQRVEHVDIATTIAIGADRLAKAATP